MTLLPDPNSFARSPFPVAEALTTPAQIAAERRNAFLDWLFYDTGGLSPTEISTLLAERTTEGAILVVWPEGERGELSVRKFGSYTGLRAAPGRLLDRFTIAGVGSSDIGAAAFARTVANHYGSPVGAIVAGYGMDDLLTEALGGWFIFGSANRLLDRYRTVVDVARTRAATDTLWSTDGSGPSTSVETGSDSGTLLRLLRDDDRVIQSLAGHSKGCLSIAYALQTLDAVGSEEARKRARDARIVTAGAVVALPERYDNVGQYIGALDWFGAMNSRPSVAAERVPFAWHHLNTRLPMHLDFGRVLARDGK